MPIILNWDHKDQWDVEILMLRYWWMITGCSQRESCSIMESLEKLEHKANMVSSNSNSLGPCGDMALRFDYWYFHNSLHRYDERIDRVETRITARLRDQLGLAKNANEMFRIFSRFNALFVRPHIRGAIREYQTQLMQRVKDDIEVLHDKFKVSWLCARLNDFLTDIFLFWFLFFVEKKNYTLADTWFS